jgi:hypothetical protein
LALVQCPNCKIQVTAVSQRCFSCGQPMPRQVIVEPAKTPKSLKVGYMFGSALVIAAFVLQRTISAGTEETLIVIGILAIIGSVLARMLIHWVDSPPR